MKDYIAIVKNANNKVTKYQDFDSKSEADAHVATHGGFVVDKPDSDRMDYWVVDASKKTVTYDQSTADSDDAAAAAVAGVEALEGRPGAMRDSLIYSAASCLVHLGRADSLSDGAELVATAIDSGNAWRHFKAN